MIEIYIKTLRSLIQQHCKKCYEINISNCCSITKSFKYQNDILLNIENNYLDSVINDMSNKNNPFISAIFINEIKIIDKLVSDRISYYKHLKERKVNYEIFEDLIDQLISLKIRYKQCANRDETAILVKIKELNNKINSNTPEFDMSTEVINFIKVIDDHLSKRNTLLSE